MKAPKDLQALIDDGVIDEVIRPLKSGKEASVYVVRAGADIRCAKVYKDMAQRSFQARVQYQEGRKVRGSREARAIGKSSSYGRKQQEAAWKNAELLWHLRGEALLTTGFLNTLDGLTTVVGKTIMIPVPQIPIP